MKKIMRVLFYFTQNNMPVHAHYIFSRFFCFDLDAHELKTFHNIVVIYLFLCASLSNFMCFFVEFIIILFSMYESNQKSKVEAWLIEE